MAIDDQPPSESPSRSTTPNSEGDRDGADESFSLEGISLSLELDFDLATDSSASSPSSEEEVLTKAGIETHSDDLPAKHAAAQKCGYDRMPPITEAAYPELGNEPELWASGLELLKKPEPVEDIFYGRYSPARDTFVRDPHRAVSQIERFVINNAFGMAFMFVEHSRSMQILPELMCIGMPLGWIHAVTVMIKNILVSFRWFVVIDPTLKPNVFTCWAGHGAPHFPNASRAIYINARHVDWLVRATLSGDLAQKGRCLLLAAACFGEEIVESLRFTVWQKYLFYYNKDIMPRVSFYSKRSADRWPSNLGWVWHLKVFGGWFVGIGKLAEDIDGFMKMVPCRGPCNLTRLGMLVPTGKHYPLTMKLVSDAWIEELLHDMMPRKYRHFRIMPEIYNPLIPLHNCRVVHSLHKNFDWLYAQAHNAPLADLRDTDDIGTLISTCIPSETRCPESELFQFDPPIQEPDPRLVQITSHKPEDLEKFLCDSQA